MKNDKFYAALNVRYEGQQKRPGSYSLDLFTDLKTGSSFLRLPFESLEQAIKRTRAHFRRRVRSSFTNPGMVVQRTVNVRKK